MRSDVPPSFTISFEHIHRSLHRLSASQVLPLSRKEAFTFFEDPRNLVGITPGWLRFVMKDRDSRTDMFEGAEFDYTIRWLRIPMFWKSKIMGYRPPDQFTDVQLAGPYRSWSHQHIFEEQGSGTLMRDIVTYRLPLGPLGSIAHRFAIKRQLENIFRYRAVRVDAWSRGEMTKRT
jgi:ligand-binding SRPBCC domain-containing protein